MTPKKKKVMVQTTRQYSIEEPKKKGKKPKRMSSWQGHIVTQKTRNKIQ